MTNPNLSPELQGCPNSAIDWLLSGGRSDMPPMPNTVYGYGCDGCFYSTLNAINTEAEVSNDRSEAYFDCALLNAEKVWGENPKCTLEDWQKAARQELSDLRAALSPQTLPAPGEGERLRAALKVARETLTNYADPTGYTDNNGDQYEADEVSHPGKLAICTLAQIDALLDREATPTLATVAVANDEGVLQMDREAFARLDDHEPGSMGWRMITEPSGEDCVGVHAFAEHRRAAIRLLSQGGGK